MSPWLLEAEEDEDEETDDEAAHGSEAHGGDNGSASDGDDDGLCAARASLELQQATFLAGHTHGELIAGSIGFFRYEHPAGVFGLRPPPLRSNVVCIMAVPSWLSSAELIRFVGGYTRYVRQMRLLRDASMPHRHMLLLQFGSPAIAERFRADYHAKRFNSLEPEVALTVHVAQIVFGKPMRQKREEEEQATKAEAASGSAREPEAGGSSAALAVGWDCGEEASGPGEPSTMARESSGAMTAVRKTPQVHIRLHVTPLSLRLSRQASTPSSSLRAGDDAAVWGGTSTEGASSAECTPCDVDDDEGVQPAAVPLDAAAAARLAESLGAIAVTPSRLPSDASAANSVRVQLWIGASKQAAVHAPLPPPPLPPSSEIQAAVQRASRGYRATLPPLPDGSLLGSAVELPSCPVCLERLDPSISGVMTIVCDHTFHCDCLRRWSDSSCPVCRHVADDSDEATCCEVCGTTESLWICLVCGHVGCGRYSGCGSGVHHNEATEHNFAMELESQRVWDYKGDNYVHRLIQNKVDGKLVELPDPRAGQGGGTSALADAAGGAGMDPAAREIKQRGQEEMYEAVVQEYSLLLTGQLEVQRRHYDERLEALSRQHTRHLMEVEQEMIAREDALRRQHAQVEREARASAKRMDQAKSAVKERDFNKELNEQLMRNQQELQVRLAAAAKREEELKASLADQEQMLRDMTFHFESQIRILQESGGGGGSGSKAVTSWRQRRRCSTNARGKRKAKGLNVAIKGEWRLERPGERWRLNHTGRTVCVFLECISCAPHYRPATRRPPVLSHSCILTILVHHHCQKRPF